MHTPTSIIVQLWLPPHHTPVTLPSVQLWLPPHHTQHFQHTTVVTSPSHATLPAYNCGYLPITHNTSSVQLWLPLHCTHHVMTCYVCISLETPSAQPWPCTHPSSAHNHSYAQTLPEQIMVHTLLKPAHITTIAIYTSTHNVTPQPHLQQH